MRLPQIILYLFLSAVLVGLNAFFVAAEFAIVKIRRTRLEELAGQGLEKARISILCVDQLNDYLSATQLGITLVSLGLGWIGEATFFNLIMFFLPEKWVQDSQVWHIVAAITAFIIITVLHVVLGELVPKSMAIQRAEQITLFVSKPLHLFFRIAQPLIRAFTILANSILYVIGFRMLHEPPLTEEELKLVMKESHEEGVISESEAQIINRAFEFSDKRAADIMIPQLKVEYISLSRTFEENLNVIKSKMHTRFPLVRADFNSVIGIVRMKDVMYPFAEKKTNAIFESVARPAVFVDLGTRQDQLMKIMKERRAHLAIVQNPSNRSNIGIVTLEDILEELVGEILDEHGN